MLYIFLFVILFHVNFYHPKKKKKKKHLKENTENLGINISFFAFTSQVVSQTFTTKSLAQKKNKIKINYKVLSSFLKSLENRNCSLLDQAPSAWPKPSRKSFPPSSFCSASSPSQPLPPPAASQEPYLQSNLGSSERN